MKKRMKDLVACLEAINQNPPNEELSKIISILKTTKSKEDDNFLASRVITIISLVPDIMNHPNNQELKRFCAALKPTDISLSPLIQNIFFDGLQVKKVPLKTRTPSSR